MDKINSTNIIPTIIINTLKNININFTPDLPNKNGGLSYTTKYTNELNIKFIKDYYKNIMNYDISDDTYIIFGCGATNLINAYYYAVQKILNREIKISSFLDNKYYILYKNICEIIPNTKWYDHLEYSDILIATSPNNPDGLVVTISKKNGLYKLFDIVYDAPQFTGIFESVNIDFLNKFKKDKSISIVSSFSKFGITGARCGYLLTRDKNIVKYINYFIKISILYNNTTGLTLCRNIYYKYYNNKDWYIKIYNKIQSRIKIFIKLSDKNNVKILNKTFNVPFIYTNKSKKWWLKNFNLEVFDGTHFMDNKNNSRISMLISNSDWNLFIKNYKIIYN